MEELPTLPHDPGEKGFHHHDSHNMNVFPPSPARRYASRVVVMMATTLGLTISTFSLHNGRENEDRTSNRQHFLRESSTDTTSLRFLQDVEEGDDNNATESCTLECCWQYETTICPNENEWVTNMPLAVSIILIILLISFSALFSGLTLGLMSLDKTGLEIVMSGDDPVQAEYARKIYPIRKDGNLLLCTLLLGNVAVNALLSILLSEYAGGLVGLISSTMLIVIFGEIVPQALCSRYALRIGSASIPLVKVIRVILYPIAGPLGKCLDYGLGQELATTYSGAEMMKLLQIHVQENVIDKETAGAMAGALTYKSILVKEVMTATENAFMLNVDDKLSFETIAKIFKTGFSRIPVYEIQKNNIIGMLIVKDLIFVDPEDDIPIRSFIQIFGRAVHVVWPDDTLGDVLSDLKKGRSHLAIVRDVNNEDEKDPFYEVKGIITLEDIIEKILGDSITDETDAVIDDSKNHLKIERAESFEWARLRLLDAKIVDELLSPSEVQAVTAHFRVNYANAVKLLTDTQLNRLVATTPVSNLSVAVQEVGQELPTDLLYKKGTPSDVCTLVLGGKVTILVGEENFRSELSSWSVLGRTALESNSYIPDFSAYVSDGPCRCLRIKRSDFADAVDASAIERRSNENKPAVDGLVLSKLSEVESIGGGDPSSVSSTTDSTNNIAPRREKLLAKLFSKRVLSEAQETTAPVALPPAIGNGNGGPVASPAAPGPSESAPEPRHATSVRFQEFVTDVTHPTQSPDKGATDNTAPEGKDQHSTIASKGPAA